MPVFKTGLSRESTFQGFTGYANKQGNSGVVAYSIPTHNSIQVEFVNGSIYEYTYDSTTPGDVEYMQRCAEDGRGLATFIGRHVKKRFERRIR